MIIVTMANVFVKLCLQSVFRSHENEKISLVTIVFLFFYFCCCYFVSTSMHEGNKFKHFSFNAPLARVYVTLKCEMYPGRYLHLLCG